MPRPAARRMPLILLLLAPIASADQPCPCTGWTDHTPPGPSPRSGAAAFYDATRNETIVVGGGGEGAFLGHVWRWNGVVWQPGPPLPTGRSLHSAVFDTHRGRGVLFGGNQSFNATAEYDGSSWTVFDTPNNPNDPSANLTRVASAMAFDESAGLTLLFGGSGPAGMFFPAYLWGFDGADWVRLADESGAPPRRKRHALAHDAGRGVTLLFGGRFADGAPAGDTWLWDGKQWQPATPAHSPSPRDSHALAYDRARGVVVLFGGADTAALGDTWEWDGSAWRQRQLDHAPPARSKHVMTYDADRRVIVLFGGQSESGQPLADLWEYDGLHWMQRDTPWQTQPPMRAGASIAFDSHRNRLVLHGGSASTPSMRDTWEWSPMSRTWTRRTASGPNVGAHHAMAFDPQRRVAVLFGGSTGSAGGFHQTWEWDGESWLQRQFERHPVGRSSLAMSYDSARREIVLFGGSTRDGLTDDTWTYDGAAWTECQPLVRPTPRRGHAMVYDPRSRMVVLFGGETADGLDAETWGWDGYEWRLLATDGPTPRSHARLAYHARLGELVLFGGRGTAGLFEDTWRWDSVAGQWRQWGEIGPAARHGHGVAAVTTTGTVLVVGGNLAAVGSNWSGETWEFGEACGCGDANCDGRIDAADRPLFEAAAAGDLDRYIKLGGSHECWARRSCWQDVNQNGQYDPADRAVFQGFVRAGCVQCRGDLDGDRDVDEADLALLLSLDEGDPRRDLDESGEADLLDLLLMFELLGAPCG